MKHLLLAFLLAFLLVTIAACKKPAPACECDCPGGPPPAGQISTYCHDPANDGKPCCGGPAGATCKGSRCVPPAP